MMICTYDETRSIAIISMSKNTAIFKCKMNCILRLHICMHVSYTQLSIYLIIIYSHAKKTKIQEVSFKNVFLVATRYKTLTE